MALQHIRALQERRHLFTEKEYSVMEVVCTDIGNHNEAAYTSQRNIAKRSAASVNTVGKYLKQFQDAGHIKITKDGKCEMYTLLWNVAAPEYETTSTHDGVTEFVTDTHELSQRIVTIENTLSQHEQRLSQIESRLSQIINLLSQRPEGNCDQRIVEEVEEVEETPAPTLPLKYPRSQFEQEFTSFQLVRLWPIAVAFQEACDIPSDIAKFYANLWEVFGYDTFKIDDIKTIAADLREKYPENDNVWPSNVITEWRKRQREGLQANPLASKAKEDFKLFADLSKLSRSEQSNRLRGLPDYLKQVYNALSTEWRKTPTEQEFVRVYQSVVSNSNGAVSHV